MTLSLVASSAAQPRYTDSGPEPLLAQVFEQIEAQPLGTAHCSRPKR